jgi:hypothetical protein
MDMVQDKVVCLGKFSKCASSTEVVESIAGLLAIQSVLTKQAGPIQVEGDCVTLVAEVNQGDARKSATSSDVCSH